MHIDLFLKNYASFLNKKWSTWKYAAFHIKANAKLFMS